MILSADLIRGLHKYELKILHSIEYFMQRYDWVPYEHIIRNTRLSAGEVEYRIGRLISYGMVKGTMVPYQGYALLFGGYDSLALSSLAHTKVISALGDLRGEGKESLVYEAMAVGPVAVKLHHVGQRSFQNVRKNRGFMPENEHCPWVFASHYSAEQEYLALKALHEHVETPVPIAMNRNVVVMSLIPGNTLNRVRLEDPPDTWEWLLDEVKKTYELGYIHGDLSEYNVIGGPAGCFIIDWPQWVSVTHENADEILLHDITTLSSYFTRRYKMEIDLKDAFSFVTGREIK